jgi:hypothetical protein
MCVIITAVPIKKLFAGGEGNSWDPYRNPVLQHRVRLFSLVPLIWESNPNLQGGWCKTVPPAHRARGIWSPPRAGPGVFITAVPCVCVCVCVCVCLLLQYLIQICLG